MIVRESQESFVFITQHDHATIAGEFFMHLRKDFLSEEHYESLKFAVFQHDRGWIVPDSAPLWNDLRSKPYDFIDYPSALKVHFYKTGIEQTDRVNSYSALLCSLHYSNYFKNTNNEFEISFLEREEQRQKHLMQRLKINTNDYLKYQLQVLQLCDDLSLYVCLNKPGVSKADEHPFFVDGFENSEFFNDKGERKVIASYSDRSTVSFNANLFSSKFDLKITMKKVLKKDIEKYGILEAYDKQPFIYQTIKIS